MHESPLLFFSFLPLCMYVPLHILICTYCPYSFYFLQNWVIEYLSICNLSPSHFLRQYYKYLSTSLNIILWEIIAWWLDRQWFEYATIYLNNFLLLETVSNFTLLKSATMILLVLKSVFAHLWFGINSQKQNCWVKGFFCLISNHSGQMGYQFMGSVCEGTQCSHHHRRCFWNFHSTWSQSK